MIRTDGSKVIVIKHPSWKTEILGLYETFKLEPYIILLFPMFFASNWFYTYQFNTFNGAKFDVRTRSLNSVLYWSAQIVGAGFFGLFLDTKMRRRSKAFIAWGGLFVLTMVRFAMVPASSVAGCANHLKGNLGRRVCLAKGLHACRSDEC